MCLARRDGLIPAPETRIAYRRNNTAKEYWTAGGPTPLAAVIVSQ
jgi:hypothetical protein